MPRSAYVAPHTSPRKRRSAHAAFNALPPAVALVGGLGDLFANLVGTRLFQASAAGMETFGTRGTARHCTARYNSLTHAHSRLISASPDFSLQASLDGAIPLFSGGALPFILLAGLLALVVSALHCTPLVRALETGVDMGRQPRFSPAESPPVSDSESERRALTA